MIILVLSSIRMEHNRKDDEVSEESSIWPSAQTQVEGAVSLGIFVVTPVLILSQQSRS